MAKRTEGTGPNVDPGFMGADATADFIARQAADAARAKDGKVRQDIYDQDLSKLSKRDQARLRKKVNKELNRQFQESRKASRQAQAELKRTDKAQRKRAAEVYRQIRQKSKDFGDRTRAKKEARNKAQNLLDAIGYELMFKNGICEVEPGVYSETMSFDDITYQNSRESDQASLLKCMFDLYNYFNAETSVQMSVINTPLRDEELARRKFFDPDAQASEQGAEDAREMNRILSEKLLQGISNIKRTRLLTITVEADDPDEGYRKLSRVNADLAVFFERLGSKTKLLDGTERLETINSMLRPGKALHFDYDTSLSASSALTTKDYVAPEFIDFAPDGDASYYVCDGKCCQVLYMRDFDSPLEDTAVAGLADLSLPLAITWHVQPIDKSEAVNSVKVKSGWIDAEIINEQMKAVSRGYDYSILPAEVKVTKEETEDLLGQLQGQNQHLFHFTGAIWTWADDFETLSSQVVQIMDKARSNGIDVELLEYRQRQGMNTVLPLGLNHLDLSRLMLTNETVIFVPFATCELDDGQGNWYYQNKLSNNLVLGNRGRLSSPVGFVAGKTGSGKGFFVKNEIENTLLSKPDEQVIIFDRAGEYLELVNHWGGQCATFGVGHDTKLNPLAMLGLEDRDDATQIAFKADAILAQAGASAEEGGAALGEEERSFIQKAVEQVFADAREEGREPILEDLYNALEDQRAEDPIAHNLAQRYWRYCFSTANFFNGVGNVDFSNRLIDLNLKEVPESMIVFALITLCEAVRYQMYSNSAKNIRTWLYIEEMESLFRYPTVLNYFARFSRECRKFGMYLTGITQSTESMIGNAEAGTIVKQADFVMLLKQSKEDRDYWADALGLSPQQLSCIDDSTPRGNGLLIFGDRRIPIKGEFPRDSYLYDLYSTDPNEQEERQRRRESRRRLEAKEREEAREA